jgi:ABC-type nitrate/sulfonate/bicarbonate transport system ATPase subunit
VSVLIHELVKRFGGQTVIASLSVTLPERGIVGLSGPSGSGKTTFLRLLAGLDEPDAGRIEGLDRGDVSMVFQEDRLLPWLSALENLSAVLPDRATACHWLELVQLADFADHYPAELSGGMKRRIALARGLAFPSSLLLLDEPFQGVDAEMRRTLYPLVRAAATERLVVLVSHDAADLANLADMILLADGPPLQIHSQE